MHYHGLLTDAEFEEQLAFLDRLLQQGRRFGLVVDTHHQRMMPIAQVRRQAVHLQASTELARRWCAGVALVIPSAVIRGVLKVVMGIAPMPVRYGLFEREAEAVAWAVAAIEANPAAAP